MKTMADPSLDCVLSNQFRQANNMAVANVSCRIPRYLSSNFWPKHFNIAVMFASLSDLVARQNVT